MHHQLSIPRRQSFPALACAIAMLAVCCGVSGCWPRPPATPMAPPLAGPPTLETLVARVNANARIQQLQAENVTVSLRGAPVQLRGASLAIQRPRNLRLRGQVMGVVGVDIGSNDELFWMWNSLTRPAGVYFARHDQFQNSAIGAQLPIRPEWLIEALGVVEIDPKGPLEGPYPRGTGQVEIRTRVPADRGEMTKIIVLDTQFGWIVQQYLYSSSGELLAAVNASGHRYYAEAGVSLPSQVEIQIPRAQATLQINVGGYLVNRLSFDPTRVWAMPQIPGSPPIDVAAPGFQLPQQNGIVGQPGTAPSAGGYGNGPTGARPNYRGFPGRR